MQFTTVLSLFVRPKNKGRTSQMILSMKLIGIFLLAAALQVSARGMAQITLQVDHAPLQEVFTALKEQTGYRFICTQAVLQKAGKLSVHIKDASLKKTLDLCFKGKGLDYSIIGQTVAVRLATEPAPAGAGQLQQAEEAVPKKQVVTVTGKVTDPLGYPLASVSVVVPGTPLGTMTDKSGFYSLSDVPQDAELVFSYVGYLEQRIQVKGQSVINVQMQPTENELNETVVIGYGTTTKRLNTGSAAVISDETIDRQPIANVMEALPGRVAGVLVTQNNGVPGANTQMEIRGKSSLNSGTIPLYVIDGVPYTNFNGAQPPNDNLNAWGISGANGGASPFSSINPDDIKSITILKDADATAIYGARGANGVVLITTKRGAAGASKTDVNVYTGMGKVSHYIPMLNTGQYLTLRKEAFANDGVDPENASSRPYDLLDWDQNAYTDWQKYLLGGTSHITNADIAYSGGTDRTSYRLSGNYRHDGTIYPGDFGNNRVTTRFSLGHHSKNNRFNFNFSASYAHEISELPKSDVASLVTLPPNYPSKLTDSVGNLIWYSGFTNPLSYLRQSYHGVTNNVIGNLTMGYEVLKNWNLKLSAGYTHIDLNQRSASPASVQDPSYNPTSTAYFSDNLVENWIVEPTTDYTVNWGKSKLNMLLGGTFQQNISTTTSTKGSNYSSDLLLGSLQGAGIITSYYPNDAKYKFASLFSRVNYNYDNKYLLNGTFRRDASSRFGPNNRFGNFWALGAAWVFTEESFVKEVLPFLSFGKLRGSYGLTGNDQITNYVYLPLYSMSSSSYQGQASYYTSTAYNPYIQWETDKKLEFALELGFLQDRLTFTGSYYRNRSGNQLTYEALPTQSGFNSRTTNMPAVIQNKGLELTIGSQNIKTQNFSWHTDFNITLPSNKLISFPGLESSYYASSYVIGESISLTKLYKYTGVDAGTGMPTYYSADGSGVPNYNTDRFIAPLGTPYYGGLGNDFSYKNWSLSFFIQYTHQKGYTNGLVSGAPGASMANVNTSYLNRWQKAGDQGTLFPAASAVSGSPISAAYGYYFASSDLFWGDASWLKLRTASVSYQFDKKLVHRLGLSQLRLYAEGQNLLTLAKNKYQMDTETTVAGGPSGLGTGRYLAVPPLRTIVVGLNVSF